LKTSEGFFLLPGSDGFSDRTENRTWIYRGLSPAFSFFAMPRNDLRAVRTNPTVYIYRKEKIAKKLSFWVKKWYNKPIRNALFFKGFQDFKSGPETP
jgi:hypothetical protein